MNNEAAQQYELGPMGSRALKTIVRGALGRDSAILIDPHCGPRMRERGFSSADVEWVLENGNYERYSPTWDEDFGCWVYSVVGKDLDDRRLKLVLTVENCGAIVRVISGQRHYRGRRV